MSLIFTEENGVFIVGTNGTENGNGISEISFSGSLTIPEFFNGHKIEEIGQYAFHSCINLVEIEIQAEISSINYAAFYNCRSLLRINIPPSVKFIGNQAFSMYNSAVTNSGTLNITFEGESQLSFAGGYNFRRRESIIIYFCGLGPIIYGENNFLNVNTLIIYSSTVSSFLNKPTISGSCPEFRNKQSYGICTYFPPVNHFGIIISPQILFLSNFVFFSL